MAIYGPVLLLSDDAANIPYYKATAHAIEPRRRAQESERRGGVPDVASLRTGGCAGRTAAMRSGWRTTRLGLERRRRSVGERRGGWRDRCCETGLATTRRVA